MKLTARFYTRVFWLTQKLAGLYVDGKVLNILVEWKNRSNISTIDTVFLHFRATYLNSEKILNFFCNL